MQDQDMSHFLTEKLLFTSHLPLFFHMSFQQLLSTLHIAAQSRTCSGRLISVQFLFLQDYKVSVLFVCLFVFPNSRYVEVEDFKVLWYTMLCKIHFTIYFWRVHCILQAPCMLWMISLISLIELWPSAGMQELDSCIWTATENWRGKHIVQKMFW